MYKCRLIQLRCNSTVVQFSLWENLLQRVIGRQPQMCHLQLPSHHVGHPLPCLFQPMTGQSREIRAAMFLLLPILHQEDKSTNGKSNWENYFESPWSSKARACHLNENYVFEKQLNVLLGSGRGRIFHYGMSNNHAWEGIGTPLQYSCLENPMDSLVGCSLWGCHELDVTEQLHFPFSLACIGEGNGNPLQCSCLENLRDGGVWWAAIYGVAQGWTWLKQLSSSNDHTYRTTSYEQQDHQITQSDGHSSNPL